MSRLWLGVSVMAISLTVTLGTLASSQDRHGALYRTKGAGRGVRRRSPGDVGRHAVADTVTATRPFPRQLAFEPERLAPS